MEKTYSALYRPDRAFMNKLKALDPRLGCKYRLDIERFAITWKMPVGQDSELLIVNDEFGGFRHPDDREIYILCEGDLYRSGLRETLARTEKYMRDYREKQDAHVKDEIRNTTKDDKIQMMNAYRKVFNVGSKTPEFRRVIPKHKGKTIDELQGCVAT